MSFLRGTYLSDDLASVDRGYVLKPSRDSFVLAAMLDKIDAVLLSIEEDSVKLQQIKEILNNGQ